MKANWYADGGRSSGLWGYGIAVAAVAGATLLKLLLGTVIQQESPFILFFGTVMLAAWLGGRRAGLLATVLSVLSADFFFMTPYFSFSPENTGQILRLVVFLVEGTLASLLVSELLRARRQAEERAAEVQGYQRDLKENEERSRRLADEVVAEIKEDDNLKLIPVLILTTSQAERDILDTYSLHANGYVSKPLDLDEFASVVASIQDFWFTTAKLPQEDK